MEFVVDREAPYLRNAFYLACVAKAVYANRPGRANPEFAEAFPRIATFREERVFGCVASNDTEAILAYRGTKENQEWKEGLAYGLVLSGDGKVHGGLDAALEGVWKLTLAALFDAGALDKTLWLCGHSLGGSLAVLAARRLVEAGFAPFVVCTYGAPRAINEEAARAFRVPAYRFVNNEDMVPDMPWPTLVDSYTHVGELVHFLASGAIAESRHSIRLARKIDRAGTIGEGPIESGMFHDHMLDSYLAKLKLHL